MTHHSHPLTAITATAAAMRRTRISALVIFRPTVKSLNPHGIQLKWMDSKVD